MRKRVAKRATERAKERAAKRETERATERAKERAIESAAERAASKLKTLIFSKPRPIGAGVSKFLKSTTVLSARHSIRLSNCHMLSKAYCCFLVPLSFDPL